MKNKNNFLLFSILLVYVFMNIGNQAVAQTQRNPVLEECTGTWCQWCPCGHDIMEQIKAAMPNAIMIGYHGPPGSSDPWDEFPGNQILGLMGFSGYPTAVIDRTGPPISRSSWASAMNTRYNVPATVSITMDKSFNAVTGELDATVHVSPLENLTGEYKMTMILLEDGLLHSQTGNGDCPGGGPDYVHNHVVRAILNGATGEELNGGNPWNIGETISKPVQYTVPSEIEADSSHLVVLVHKVQGGLSSGEIQQAEEWTLVSPDYVATISSTSQDIISANSSLAEFSTVVRSDGILDDSYYIDITMDAPVGWTGEYTSDNGTFPFSHQDLISVPAGDSAVIMVTVNPNGIDGYGNTQVQFTSMNDPGVIAIAYLRNITTTGVEVLVVDASEEDYGSFVSNSLDNVYTGTHGQVSRNAINALVDLSNFHAVTWSAGNETAAFYPEEVSALEDYLEGGGNLFINGQNIGSDIFEPGGQSQFAQSFYNNYLHADYIANSGPNLILQGYDGDPITNGIQPFVIGDIYERSADEIAPFDGDATPILKFLVNPPKVSSIRVSTSASRIVYLGIGFEQITDEAVRDTIMARSINWLAQNTVGVAEENNSIPDSYSLDQNYPNPFNPSTKITYSVLQESPVTIKVFDLIGQEVAVLVDEIKEPGFYSVTFDALGLTSGVYIYQMKAGNFTSSKKMSVLK
jgi:hypothetical protein